MTTPTPAPASNSAAPTPVTAGTTTAVWIVALIVVAAAVGGLGFYAGYEYRGSPAATPGATANSTLSILGAGTLTYTFPQVANQLVNETPGISAPAAAQTYEGSLDITTAITTLGAKADVAALADFRLTPQLLEPTYANYEIVFATTQEVLIYNSSLPAFSGVNSTNWGAKLVADVTTPGNAKFGVWNASTDPNGYNEIFAMELQGMLYNGSTSAIYDQFYTTGANGVAVGNGHTIIEHESQAATLVKTGVLSAVITYRSYAVVNDMSYVSFNPIVGLVATCNSMPVCTYVEKPCLVTSREYGPIGKLGRT